MEQKLFDSELKIMELLWEHGEMTAKDLAAQLGLQVGWSKTTTYTVIKKCVDKGAVDRLGTNFLCRPRITREQVREREAEALVDKYFDGAADQLVASLLGSGKLGAKEIDELRQLIDTME